MKKQLTAAEISEKWEDAKKWLFAESVFLVVFLVCFTLAVVKNWHFAVYAALVYGILTFCILPFGIYGLIRYGKTGRLINRWTKITGEPIEQFPMYSTIRERMWMWAREKLTEKALAHEAAKRSVEDEEHSCRCGLDMKFPMYIKPNDVLKLEQELTIRANNHEQRLNEAKRKEAQARKEYDAWWDLLHDLKYDDPHWTDRKCLLPFHPVSGKHFRNPAHFSAWVKNEDARKEQLASRSTGLKVTVG